MYRTYSSGSSRILRWKGFCSQVVLCRPRVDVRRLLMHTVELNHQDRAVSPLLSGVYISPKDGSRRSVELTRSDVVAGGVQNYRPTSDKCLLLCKLCARRLAGRAHHLQPARSFSFVSVSCLRALSSVAALLYWRNLYQRLWTFTPSESCWRDSVGWFYVSARDRHWWLFPAHCDLFC